MKKVISMATVFTLLFMLMAALTGCGEKEKFVGTWKVELDMAEDINDAMDDEEVKEYMSITSFPITLLVTFSQDGTYKIKADRDSISESLEGMKADMVEGMKSYVEATIAAEEIDMTLEQFMALAGVSFEELVEESFENFEVDPLLEGFSVKGTYEAEKGKLYLSEEKDSGVNKNVYEACEFDGDSLKLNEHVVVGEVGEATQNMMERFYPMVLKKVQ